MQAMRIYIYMLAMAALTLSACGGADFMPNYFPTAQDETAGSISAPPTALTAACTIQFDATLCVALKRGDWGVGTEGQEKKCAEDLPPIPIRIQGSKASLHGDEFPDIVVPSGSGLPVPITINGKGKTDGKDNTGDGAVDSAGNITIRNFSIFITALGVSGKIPNLTLTTGTAEGTAELPAIRGVPASGSAMTLVGSTVLGSVIPAADKYLLGATLQVTFKGTISPKLSECSGAGSSLPTTIQVSKITTDEQKRQHEQIIPNGTQMEVATDIFIPGNDTDSGAQFEGSSRFRIRNIGRETIPLQIPPIVGPFRIKTLTGDLTAHLPSQQSIIIQVSFRPTPQTKPGIIQETLGLGSDYFTLIGVAKEQRGIAGVHLMDATGTANTAETDTIRFPDIPVSAFSQLAYFQCDSVSCNGTPSPVRCQPCVDVASNRCQSLPVDRDGLPIGEVDARCTELRPKAKESQGINLQGGNNSTSQTIVIRNTGTKDLTITALDIADLAKSRSIGQFRVSSGTPLPATLPPHSDRTVVVVVTYAPTDLLGSSDDEAGTTSLDQALLLVHTTSNDISEDVRIKLRGTTTITETPPLEIYFKTSTGYKMHGNDSDFPLKGITQATQNVAVPVYAKLADSAGKTLRITGVELAGNDADHFAWLDTADKISAMPESERCSTTTAPVPIRPDGITIMPQAYTLQTMPFLGCINFRRDPAVPDKKRVFESTLMVTAVELDAKKQPIKRPDGSLAESVVRIRIVAAINPRSGPQVFRLTQTMAILTTSQSPTMAAASSDDEVDTLIKLGRATEADRFLFLGAITLDPFDEMTVMEEDGTVATAPGDGITSVFHAIDTRPSSFVGSDLLAPYTSFVHDGQSPSGSRGIFFDPAYKTPAGFQTSGLRIYTASLSWPGPLEKDPNKIPFQVSDCQQVDPCVNGDMLGKGPTDKTRRGVCAFFYVSAGSWDSPSMHRASEMEGGIRDNLCKSRDERQKLNTLKGNYFPDGRLVFENNALRFWGPTFVHNIANSLDRKPPALDDIFHIAFSTDVMVPREEGGKYDYVPEKRINLARQEYKVNLTDTEDTSLCDTNTQNKIIGDRTFSSWKYFAPFLVQDKEGKIPAGCPEDDNSFPKSGSRAYLRGRPVDPATGTVSIAAVTKFGNDEDLTFVFKDVLLYTVLNGWLCDPNGSEAEGEGSKCFDMTFSERDRLSTISAIREGNK